MKAPRKLLFFIPMLIVAAGAEAQTQNLLVNGSFETPPITNKSKWDYVAPAVMFPWQTTATLFEVWTNGWVNHKAGYGPADSADGVQNIEILSNTNKATVWQTVPTVPGTSYVFNFFHTPRPGYESILTVSVDSNVVAIFDENGKGLTNFDWQWFTTNYTAVSNNTTLSFSDLSLNFGGAGTHIDGVVLETNLVVNGSFEAPPITNKSKWSYLDPSVMFPWQTTATEFEVWTNGWVNHVTGVGPVYSADGGQNIEILSDTNQATVWQDVPTIPCTSYVFSFYHTPRPGTDSILTVSAESNVVAVLDETGVGLTNVAWQRFTTNFVAAGTNTTLSFADVSLNGGGAGTHIDGVVLGSVLGQGGTQAQTALVQNVIPVLQTPPLVLSMQVLPNSPVQCYWPTLPNHSYQLQYSDSLESPDWTNLGAPLLSTGTAIFVEDSPPADASQRFYRVLMLQ
jgi:hypothetical protein